MIKRDKTDKAKFRLLSPTYLQGFSHAIKTNGSGAALLDFLILDTDGLSWELRPVYRCTRRL